MQLQLLCGWKKKVRKPRFCVYPAIDEQKHQPAKMLMLFESFLYMSVVIYADDNLRDFWQQVRHVKRRNDQKLSLSGYPYIYN